MKQISILIGSIFAFMAVAFYNFEHPYLGLLFTIIAVISYLIPIILHSKKDKKAKLKIDIQKSNFVKHPKFKLQKEQIKILLLLHKYKIGLPTSKVSQYLNLSPDIINYHLQNLCKSRFIRKLSGQDLWSIEDEGMEYLIENKLIS